jgi:hypothetical protein
MRHEDNVTYARVGRKRMAVWYALVYRIYDKVTGTTYE